MLPRLSPSARRPHLLIAAGRTLLARRPIIRRVARIGVIGAVVMSTWSGFASIDNARDNWGRTVTVIVASTPLRPGDTLDSADTTQWPVGLVPDEALTTIDRRAVVRRHVGSGEVLTSADVGESAGIAGLVPLDRRVAHVPATPDQRSLIEVGDQMVVIIDGRSLARGPVVAIGDTSVAVAVPDNVVAAVADGVLRGGATLALAP
jgi:hypothetical protein